MEARGSRVVVLGFVLWVGGGEKGTLEEERDVNPM
jgi:hypothetical protein